MLSVCLGFICTRSLLSMGLLTCVGWNLFNDKRISHFHLKWSKKVILGAKEIASRVLGEDGALGSSASTRV